MMIEDAQLFPIYESLESSSENYQTTSSLDTENPTCEINSPSAQNSARNSSATQPYSPFNSYYCSHHPQKKLDLVCTEEQCTLNGLICNLCAFERHYEHVSKCIPVELFIEGINHSKHSLVMEQLRLQRECYELRIQEEELLRYYQSKINQKFNEKFLRLNNERRDYLEQTKRITSPTEILLEMLNEDIVSQSQCSGILSNILKKVKLDGMHSLSNKKEFIQFDDYTKSIEYLEKMKSALIEQREFAESQIAESCECFIKSLIFSGGEKQVEKLEGSQVQRWTIATQTEKKGQNRKQEGTDLEDTNKKSYPCANLNF